MMRLFARRRDGGLSLECRIGPGRPGAAEPAGRRARRRVRPGVEALDARLLLSSGRAVADAAAVASVADRVAMAVDPYIAQGQFPGISVAVVRHGKVALAGGYGLSDVASGALVQAGTRFQIASVTKTFTALGVLLLHQQSEGTDHPLNLDAPIGQYLHGMRSFRLPLKWSHITTRELLDMTSGLRDVGSARPWQAQLASIARTPLLYAPGTESSYSSANYDLLGALIEQRTGERYTTFIQDQILRPLGMTATQVLGPSAAVPGQALGYGAPRNGSWSRSRVARQNGRALYAAAGMVSTAQDMATYMTALLAGRILDPATYRMMWSSTPTPQYGTNTASARGLGWDTVIATSDGPIEVTKSGRVPGYSSELILYPASDSGVFVAMNTNAPDPATVLRVAESVYQAVRSG